MVDDSRWQSLWSLFHDALERPPAEREAWLRAQAADDPELLRELHELLAAHEAERNPLDREPVDLRIPQGFGPGSIIERYRIVRELGRGGMGSVFLAERTDGAYAQAVALKLIAPGLAHPALIARFRRERQIMAALVHPGIARLLDGGTTNQGLPYLVMQHIDGEPIDRWCASHATPLRERLRLVAAVCDAVDHAHRQLVVHRDIKPANVLIDAGGAPVLLDFGIAKLLGTDIADGAATEVHGMRAMTPRYASPEQLLGKPIGTASDVYSLGVLLFELCSGGAPFALDGLTPGEAATRIQTSEPVSLRSAARVAGERLSAQAEGARESERLRRERLPAELDWIVRRALKPEPEQRYRSAQALAQDLRNLLAHRPLAARPDSLGYRFGKFIRRRWAWVAVAAVFVVVLSALLLQLALETRRTRAALAATEVERDRAERVGDFLRNLFKAADTTQSEGREIGARELLDRGRTQLAQRTDLSATARVALLNALAEVYRNMGDYAVAGDLLQQSRALLDAGGSDNLRATTLENLGATYELRGDHQQAQSVLTEAVALRRAQARSDPLALADALELAAVTEQSLGSAKPAGALFSEAYGLRAANLPERDGRVADAALRMGSWYWSAGDFDQTSLWYRRALASRRAQAPSDLPELARTLDANAALAHAQGRYNDAIALFEEALDLRRRVLGNNHRHTADTLSNMGACRFDMGDDARAEPELREALAIYERVLPAQSPVLAKTLNNLGLVRQRQHDRLEARALFERALSINRAAYGSKHARVAGNLNNLGVLAEDEDNLDAAARAYVEAIAIQEAALGLQHPQLAYSLTNLARVRYWQGATEASSALFERALSIRRSALPAGHPALAETLTWFGFTRCAGSEHESGLTMLREATALREPKLGADAVPTVETRAMLGACLVSAGETAAGRDLIEQAMPALLRARSDHDRLVRAVAARL